MVKDYTTNLYEPAAASSTRLNAAGASGAKTFSAWKTKVRQAWPGVAVHSTELTATGIRAHVGLGGLAIEDLLVEAVHGAVDADGEFVRPTMAAMTMVEARPDGTAVFAGEYSPTVAGAYGATVRVLPNNPESATTAELGLARWR